MSSEAKAPDPTEQLARLGKLHADGTLSDAEFAALKAKLISQIGSERKESPAQQAHVPPTVVRERTNNNAAAGRVALIVLGTIVILVVGFFVWSYNSQSGSSSGSAWNLAQSKDPMTDANVLTATTSIKDDDGTFRSDVEMKCTGSGASAEFSMTWTFFDNKDKGESLRMQFKDLFSQLAASYKVRFGSAEAQEGDILSSNLAYTNQISLPVSPTMPASKQMVLQPALKEGDPTFALDLSSDEPQAVFKTCSAAFP